MDRRRGDGTGRDNLDLAQDYTRMGAQALCVALTVASGILSTIYYFSYQNTHTLLAAVFAWSMMVVPGLLSRFRHNGGRKRRISRSSRDEQLTSNDLIKEVADWLFILWGLGSLFAISYAAGIEIEMGEDKDNLLFSAAWCFAVASIFGHYFSKENKDCVRSKNDRLNVTQRQLNNLRKRASLYDNYEMLKSLFAVVSGVILFFVSDEFGSIQVTAIVFTLLYGTMYFLRKLITLLICNNCFRGLECGKSKLGNLAVACITGLFQFILLGKSENERAWLASGIFILSLVVEHYNVRFKCDKKQK